MYVGGLYDFCKLLKQHLFLDNGGRCWPVADRWRDCGDASRALLFVCYQSDFNKLSPSPSSCVRPSVPARLTRGRSACSNSSLHSDGGHWAICRQQYSRANQDHDHRHCPSDQPGRALIGAVARRGFNRHQHFDQRNGVYTGKNCSTRRQQRPSDFTVIPAEATKS
jgi:hypothetical protein